jgi:hypothetical protein
VLSFLSNTRVYLAAGATDLRKSFDTLAGVVRDSLSLDPLSGHLFVFTNSRRNRIKILFWDNTGWWVCADLLGKLPLVEPGVPELTDQLIDLGLVATPARALDVMHPSLSPGSKQIGNHGVHRTLTS